MDSIRETRFDALYGAASARLAWLRPAPRDHTVPAGLKEIPDGEAPPPLSGAVDTVKVIHDLLGFVHEKYERYGELFRVRAFFQDIVIAVGPDANQFVLQNRDQVFSNRLGYEPFLRHLFPGGLMLRDFDEHRQHRMIMQNAFRRSCMEGYLASTLPLIESGLERWSRAMPFYFFPAVQRLTLDLAAEVFLGEAAGREADRLAHAFEDVASAISAVVPIPVPGLKLGKAVRSRRLLAKYFRSRIAERRRSELPDLFSQMCQAKTDDGVAFTDDELVDHMIFLTFAAHDTTTCAMTTMIYGLASKPEWQERLREEVRAIGDSSHRLCYADLERMPCTEWALREALRLYPSVPVYMRKSVKDATFKDYHIPADTLVFIVPAYTHRMGAWWNNPDEFDPARFAPDRAENKRHAFQWIPFGGGAHTCIGMQFAYLQVKAILFYMLNRFRLRLEPGYRPRYQQVPLPKPRDGLRLTLDPL